MQRSVVRLGEAHWQTLRDLRLAALTDAPTAFWSTLDAEGAFTEGDWRSCVRRSTWFVATEAGRSVGIAGGVPPGESRQEPELIGMWVVPRARRRGTGLSLIRAVEQWALTLHAGAVGLWVVKENDAALRLYETAGYRPTGQLQGIPHDPDRVEMHMRRALLTQRGDGCSPRTGRRKPSTP